MYKKKDSEMAGVKIEKNKQRVVFDVPVKMLTGVTLRALLNGLEKKTELAGRKWMAFSNGDVETSEGSVERYYFDKEKQMLVFENPLKKLSIDALIILITYLPPEAGIMYGNMSTLTLRDNLGRIVGKLYMLPNGSVADDSWLKLFSGKGSITVKL